MKRLYTGIVGLLIIVGCAGLEKKEIKLKEVGLDDCMGKSIMLTLPTGLKKTDRNYYEEGFIIYYSYTDSSIVSILCGANAELNLSEIFDENKLSRKERILGRTMIYENVPKERKMEFDKAFDQMME